MIESLKQGVLPEHDVTFESNLMIPEIAIASNDQYSDIIEISYELQIAAVSEGFHMDFEMMIPITVLSGSMGSALLDTQTNMSSNLIHDITPSAPSDLSPIAMSDLRKF